VRVVASDGGAGWKLSWWRWTTRPAPEVEPNSSYSVPRSSVSC
jgi:hypothetical protein